MAERLRPDPLAAALGLAAAAAALLAVVASTRVDPVLIAMASLVALGGALLVWRFGRLAPSMVLLAAVPLMPVVTLGFLASVGGQGAALRAALIVATLLVLLVIYRRGIPKPPPRLRPIVLGLLALSAIGGVVAVANVTDEQGLVDLLQRHVGQPLMYAGILLFLAAQLREPGPAKEWMLIALSVGVWMQAAIVVFELASGAAFDPVRGFTRAQGTIGANFVSAYAMMAFFVGMAERRYGLPWRWMPMIGTVTMLASVLLMVAVVARGGVIGLLVGFAYLIATDARIRRRAKVAVVVVVVALVGSLLTPAADLWSDRLSSTNVSQFDRPATWVSGVRIGIDNPYTGLGDEPEMLDAVLRNPRYRNTPFGFTQIVPHNSWIFAFAEGGAIAALALILLTVLAFMAVRRRPQKGGESRYYVAALIGITAIAVINNVFRHPELMLVVLFLLALLMTRPADRGAPRDGGPAARL